MNWIPLTDPKQLSEIEALSKSRPQVIFKHSTRCSVSAVAKNRLEKAMPTENTDFYYLDLITYRSLSNQIAEHYSVYHESPQVLLIIQGACVYDESHSGIQMDDIQSQISSVAAS